MAARKRKTARATALLNSDDENNLNEFIEETRGRFEDVFGELNDKFEELKQTFEATQTWTTREGIKMNVREMSDEHLANTFAMLNRKVLELRTAMDRIIGHRYMIDRELTRRDIHARPGTEAPYPLTSYQHTIKEARERLARLSPRLRRTLADDAEDVDC